MKTNTKLTRNLERSKVVNRRLKIFGREIHPKNDIISVENISFETRFPTSKFSITVQNSGNLALKQVSNRKGFSHNPLTHSQYQGSHLSNRMVKEREKLRTEWNEAELSPMSNSEQRELRRFIKKPSKRLLSRDSS